jgi:NAD-dependent deacetylase
VTADKNAKISTEERNLLRDIAQRLVASDKAVAFTGAGISTESGIPDFRSPGGVWSRTQPVMYQEFLADHDARVRYWEMKKEVYRDFARAEPNSGHRALAKLEDEGRICSLITQNIDGLHQRAGSRSVLELHGTNLEATCVSCAWRCPIDDAHGQLDAGQDVPSCPECRGWLKPATVSFGQNLPYEVLKAAEDVSLETDLFLAIGSSLVVHPAAGLPETASRYGAFLAIFNREPTPLDDMADVVIRAPIGMAFDELMRFYELYRDGIADSNH